MRFIFLSIVLFMYLSAMGQDKPAYQLFSDEGKPVRYEKMLRELQKSELILFGELHNNPICHWLELQVTQDLFAQHPELTLGMEMFEADDQLILDEYLAGIIEEKHLLSEAKVWNNYDTDYRPLLEFAKQHQLQVVASNIPRRYANLVYRESLQALDSLSDTAQQWIAPLPIDVDLTLPGYKDMMDMMGGHGNGEDNKAENLAHAQAVKDATMAHFVLKHFNSVFLHFNGAYHSQNYEGIVWYLKKARPDLKVTTIHTVEQEQIDALEEENKNTADFIICIPADMTKTH